MAAVKNIGMLLIIFFIASCTKQGNSEEQNAYYQLKVDSLYKAVMLMHDEIMPDMDEVMNQKILLKEEIGKIADKSDSISIQRKMVLEIVLMELNDADESMMEWMRSHTGKPADSISVEIALEMVSESYRSIETVKEKMNISLYHSNNVLDGSMK